MNTELMRVLRPKITPATMVRKHIETATSIALTTATLGVTFWTAYAKAWTDVMFPRGIYDD